MAKDPYNILGISKTASDEEIRSAYRKLAKKYHPDLNPENKEAVDKFKDVSAAYDFLKDKEKRAAFDRGEIDMQGQPRWAGQAGAGPQQGRQYYRDFAQGDGDNRYYSTGNINPEDLGDIFGSMFGGATRAHAGGGFEDIFRRQQNADVNYRLEIDFMDAALGAQKQITMPDGKSLNLKIPEGVKEGQKLRVKGKGQTLADGRTGDAYIEILIRPHKHFARKGNDVYSDVPIGIHEAVLGGKINVGTIHGEVQMNLPKGTSSGKQFRLKGKGIRKGDHYARIKITMPATVDPELERLIREWANEHAYNPRGRKEAV